MPVTPYMAMTLPAVSATLGPQWATELNAALAVVDAHDHSSGHGVPVRPAGIYMDADLNFRNVHAYALKSSRFQIQGSLLGSVNDVNCIYFHGADMYVNDAAGNQIQITSGGGIAGTPGSISGLVSPASVVYTPASTRFDFYSNSLVRASLACGPLTIAEAVASGKGVTISAPAGLTANYGLELPAALPATTKFLTLSAAGLIGASYDVDGSTLEVSSSSIRIKNGGVTRVKMESVGQQISSSCGLFSRSGSEVDVTNLSITITTSGRPVVIALIADGTSSTAGVGVNAGSTYFGTAYLSFYRDTSRISYQNIIINIAGTTGGIMYVPASSFQHLDAPVAGTYTYKVKASSTSLATAYVYNCKLMAFEL